jgi:hypothetical protein
MAKLMNEDSHGEKKDNSKNAAQKFHRFSNSGAVRSLFVSKSTQALGCVAFSGCGFLQNFRGHPTAIAQDDRSRDAPHKATTRMLSRDSETLICALSSS